MLTELLSFCLLLARTLGVLLGLEPSLLGLAGFRLGLLTMLARLAAILLQLPRATARGGEGG